MDTHINAYEMEVQEKLAEVQKAQAEYQATLDRLDAKKKELGVTDSGAEPKTDESSAEEKPKPGFLNKKK